MTITNGNKSFPVQVPAWVDEIFLITDRNPEMTIKILSIIDGEHRGTANVRKHVRNAQIRSEFDSLLGGPPYLSIMRIYAGLGNRYNLSPDYVRKIIQKK